MSWVALSPDGSATKTRVLVADDRAAFRSAVRRLLAAARRLELVGEADCGEQALAIMNDCNPDLVLVDVRMPGMGGISAARAIKRQRPSTVVVLISGSHPSELPPEASTSGADAVIWKPDLRPGVLEAIWQQTTSPQSPRGFPG